MNLHETRHGAGDHIAAHRHELAYAALVLDGDYEEASPEGVWRLEAGDLVVHPPYHLHLNRFERGGVRVLNITLPHAIVRRLASHSYGVVRPRDADALTRARDNDVVDALGDTLADAATVSPPAARDWLDAFADALRAEPAMQIGVLAQRFGVTPTHAARAFGRRFGLTPAAFRAEQRLRAGLQCLAAEDAVLADIAAVCGFADQSHMTRTLVAATGQTPSRLRAAFARS